MLTRRPVVVASVLAVVTALALGGVAGAHGDGKKLSKKAFIAEGNEICGALNSEMAAMRTEHLGTATPDDATLQAFVEDIDPSVHEAVEELRELKGPKADRKKMKKITSAMEEAMEGLEEEPAMFTMGDAFAESNELADEYGFHECAELGEEPHEE